MSNVWEVEQKYRVAEKAGFLRRLEAEGYALSRTESNCDEYFRHPSRNFRQTDEALRLRRIDDQAVMTYKGPKRGGIVKTRQEIELDIMAGDFDKWSLVFQKLGFSAAAQVKKVRQVFLREAGDPVVTFDDVEQVGTFAEVELIAGGESELETAESAVRDMAGRLGLVDLERRSYLSMLLEKLGLE